MVIVGHDCNKTFESSDLNNSAGILCGFANNLHDVVSFTLEKLVKPNRVNCTEEAHTSRSKLSLTKSREFLRAVIAAN